MTKRSIWIFSIALMVQFGASVASAEDYKLPDATEMQSFSPEALQFYNAGVAALDRVDYSGAYNQLAKAAQLNPGAIKLDRLVAGLAIKQGRSSDADKARDFYETAVVSLRSVLAQPHLDPDVRREVENQLKIALDEQANLAQRDVLRQAVGETFIRELNRTYASPTPGKGVAPPSIPAAGGNPLANSGLAPQPGTQATPIGPIVPGVGTPAPPPGIPTLPYPQQTPLPQTVPGQPGVPPLPGPAPAPGTQPGGVSPPGV
jgi:hypothetical protein